METEGADYGVSKERSAAFGFHALLNTPLLHRDRYVCLWFTLSRSILQSTTYPPAIKKRPGIRSSSFT